METIKVTTEAGGFEFRSEERIMDTLQIEQLAAKFAGGYENLAELKLLTTRYYEEYQQKLKQALTNEEYQKRIEILKQGDEVAEEKQQILKELIGLAAMEFTKFSEVNNTLENVYKIARASVMQIQRHGTPKLEDLPTDKALEIISKLEEELIFFRREKEPAAPADPVK